jgi:hypothetical protein
MLGDGHISRNSRWKADSIANNALLVVQRAIIDVDYLKSEAQIFYNLLTSYFQNRLVTIFNPKIDPRTGKSYPACRFKTTCNPVFTEYHNKWYHNRTKIVPTNLLLSSVAIAHWIADDGSIIKANAKLTFRFKMEISTHGFSEVEVNFLADLLCARYNEKFLVFPRIRNNKKQFIILAYDSACRALISDIDPYFNLARKRIWDKPDCNFYQDQPERQVSRNDLFLWRKEKMQEIINNNSFLSTKKVKQLLQYKGNGGNVHLLKTILPHFQDQISIDHDNHIIYFKPLTKGK